MKSREIFFVTGVNGAGKSTIIPLLKKLLANKYRVYDFDERGVPKKVDKKWRVQTTRHWFRVAHQNAQHSLVTVICGLTVPSEVLTIAKKNQPCQVRIALLDISKKKISLRLRRRFSTPAKVKNLKAVTGLSVSECIGANIQHAKTLRRESKKYRCRVFVTSQIPPKKTATRVADWILG